MRKIVIFSLAAILKSITCEEYLLPDTAYGDTFDILYDNDSEMITMKIKVKINSWFGFGWGPTMTDTSMIEWSAGETDELTYFQQLWSVGDSHPPQVSGPCYTMTSENLGDGFRLFTSTRPLECGNEAYVVPLDT